jgi:hypothetical protein
MLLAISVSAEDPAEESDEVPRVSGGTTSVVFVVACVEAIDASSSSWTTCTAEVDLEPVPLEVIKPKSPSTISLSLSPSQMLRAEGMAQIWVTSALPLGC